MLRFKIHEIPGGKSTEHVSLDTASAELALETLKSGQLRIEFDKSHRLIQAQMSMNAIFDRICDRSLEHYDQPVKAQFTVLFKADLKDDVDEVELSMRPLNVESNQIDLTEFIRDSLLLALPVRSLHPRYLNEKGEIIEFETRHFGPADSEPSENEPIDQRWAKLKQLKEQTD